MAGDIRATEAVAERLRAAFTASDPDILAGILDPDVRWGGEEDAPETCHSREDVLAWYKGLYARGVRATVAETWIEGDHIILALDVHRPDGLTTRNYQRFTVRDGAIVDIRDNEEAPVTL